MSHPTETCPKIRQQLALYAGRDLEEPLCVEVERHLAECESCRSELARAERARERIALLGAQTALAVESVDLWPRLRERWTIERASVEPAAALTPSRAPRSSRRILIPLALAAAAVLAIAKVWNSEQAPPAVPPISHVGDPAHPTGPVEDVAVNAPATDVVPLQPEGGLRRAAPGEERLRDSSAPFGTQRPPWLRRTSQDTPNSLAGDNDLR